MKRLFLASSIHRVAADIADRLPSNIGRRLVFVVTASETDTDSIEWRDNDREALVAAGFEVTDYTFTGKTAQQIAQDLERFDVVCIEGGNTYYLLEQIQKTGAAPIIVDLVQNGMPYIGSSAGSIVAGPDIYPVRHTDDVSEFRHLSGYTGLELVDFVILPHWGQPYFKDLYLGKRMKFNYNENYKLLFMTDNQYVYVEDEWMKFIDVSSDAKQI